MPLQLIDLGAAPNDATGDTLREAGAKINADMQEIEAHITTLAASLPDMDAMSRLAAFRTGQHVDQIEILKGNAEHKQIAFADADDTFPDGSWIFFLEDQVILPTTMHIQLTPEANPGMATLTGVLEFAAVDTLVYGGGRTGPNPEDFYFKATLMPNRLQVHIQITSIDHFQTATDNLQLDVYEYGKPFNVTSEEAVTKLIEEAETPETVVYRVSGNTPSKANCAAAAGYLGSPAFSYARDRVFLLDGGPRSRMFLIHYESNGDVDEAGGDHKFWFESLSEAQ